MYKFVKHFNIRFIDVDAYDNLKLSSLLSFLEEAACASADELGFGYEALKAKGLGFILSNWYVRLSRPIKYGESVTVNTWPLKPRFFIFPRDFEIFVGDEKIGAASSRWCLFNLNNYSVVSSSEYFKDGDFDNYNTERSVDFSDWKIRSALDGKLIYSKIIRNSDYDHYFHVHNTRYADFLMDAFSVDEFAQKSIESVQINYLRQCKENDVIDFIRSEKDGYFIVEGVCDRETRIQMRLKFNEI